MKHEAIQVDNLRNSLFQCCVNSWVSTYPCYIRELVHFVRVTAEQVETTLFLCWVVLSELAFRIAKVRRSSILRLLNIGLISKWEVMN